MQDRPMVVEGSESAGQPGQLHFLLVEDNPLDVELVQRTLRRAEFDFTSAVVQTPEDFTREVRSRRPDVVLADYSLPQWSGMEGLEILAREGLNVPLILVSGMLGEETAVECIKQGATDYVLKRALARLPVAIRRALREAESGEQRKLAEELFRRAVEAAPSGILMADESGKIVLANAQAAKLFGYQSEEMAGQSIEMLVPERFRGPHREHRAVYSQAPAERRLGHGRDLCGLRQDGTEFPAEIGLNPVQTARGTETLVSVMDITARKEAERAAAAYTRELQRSNAELEQFAYIAAHDLQEPLRMVASYCELLGERYRDKLDEKGEKFIGYAIDGAKRMQLLLNDLLEYSRVGTRAKPLQPTDAEAVLTVVLRGLQKAVEANQAVIVRRHLPSIQADEVQLGQVFQNLIGNALKFHGERAPRIQVSAEVVEKMVRFAVSDNGIGMEKESSGRIFQMFQRLHSREEYEGSGIGLAIAKKIVERHGGTIWFESVPGEGTTFYFTMLAAAPAEANEGRSSAAAAG
ncbi:MAG TPA: ATP-binding protein [Candidatus Sulfotelmatobacter sp.]|nr:ATP-binding protein [Candidatus Sulfotelmatobacter sp.]